jgi:hypothetical protein
MLVAEERFIGWWSRLMKRKHPSVSTDDGGTWYLPSNM